MPHYVPSAKARATYNIGTQTLRNWAIKGVINAKSVTNPSGRKTWLYDLDSIGNMLDKNSIANISSGDVQKLTILYCRVSTSKQKCDLDRQRDLLKTAYPDSEIITDIGSGLNYNKPGLTKLVGLVCRESVSRIVVTFKDRLLRYGYELFEQMCKEHNVKIVVYTESVSDIESSEENETQELQEDLLAIVNVFVARRNAKKGNMLRKLRREAVTKQCDEDKVVPDHTTKT